MNACRPLVVLGVSAVLAGVAALAWRGRQQPPDLSRWDPLIERAAAEADVDADLLRALVAVESGGDPRARSRAGAVGLCQLMPATAREQAALLGIDDFDLGRLLDPETNLRLGAAYLARQLRRFEGQVPFALAAYNAGPARVLRWRGRAPDLPAEEVVLREGFEETRRHMQRALRYLEVYRSRHGSRN